MPQKPMEVILKSIGLWLMSLTVNGTSPICFHQFGVKARQELLDRQQGVTKKKVNRNPLEDFFNSLHLMPDGSGVGFPAGGFKAAFVTAANDVDLKKTVTKRSFNVVADNSISNLVRISGPALDKAAYTKWDHLYKDQLEEYHEWGISMREDYVRLAQGSTDVRFRGFMPIWKADLNIEFNASVISAEQLANLCETAGFGCGIGEWRPSSPFSSSGSFGCWLINRNAPFVVQKRKVGTSTTFTFTYLDESGNEIESKPTQVKVEQPETNGHAEPVTA